MSRLAAALETRYRVGREIGVGGMATVYLAHDLRHERDVAIKVLHPDLAAALGAERFLAEIKTTAKLQHPHILPLLDSGEAGGLLYYVMPYVAGESLRTKLDRETQLAVDDAVRIAREVASALDYAHRNGVVHRDIKPENILIHENQALVADFGIALAVSAAGGARMTQTGLSLGTPAYMAPEQAMGERAIDGRADIYALGAVLYEMLVGEAPFTGPTVQAIVARVMTESPRPVTGQRKSVPASVNAAVLRALEKLPADRFHTAAEFSTALVTPVSEIQGSTEIRAQTPRRTNAKSMLPWAISAASLLVAAVFAAKYFGGHEETKPTHLAIDLPADLGLPPFISDAVGISADGQMVAFGAVHEGRSNLYLRRLDDGEITRVYGSGGVQGSAEFSADGKWLAYATTGKIFKVPVKGGVTTQIASSNWAQMAWLGNEAIIYTTNYDSGLNRAPAEGGEGVVLTQPDRKKGELGHWWPQVLPDGEHLLFTNYTTPADRSRIEVVSLKNGKRRVVLEAGYFGRYVSGHLLFVRKETLMSVPFDIGSMSTRGSVVPVGLDVEINSANGWAGFATSPNGTIVYRTDALKDVELKFSDERGVEEPAIDSTGRYAGAMMSPDSRRIAVIRDGDVWVYDRQRKLFGRLTQTEQREIDLAWTPDSREVIYGRDVPQYDIFKRVADGSAPEELVVTSTNDKEAGCVTRDGKTLLYDDDTGGNDDIYAISLNTARKTGERIIGGPGHQSSPRISPDGLWVAYSSNESGRWEVYLSPFPVNRGPARQQVSNRGGAGADWGADGRTIYYSSDGGVVRVRVNPRTGEIGEPERLARMQPALGWTTTPDGRFLIARISRSAERHSLKVILNWASTLNERD